jgi:outer membrane lipoprotein SlyB
LTTQKNLLATAMIVGLASLAGTATAQQFTATATVQNAVTITQTTALAFGTVFASLTSADAAPGATSADKLTLAPLTGAITRTPAVTAATDVAATVISLGGGVAGVFTAPNLPSNGKVQVIINDADGDEITNAASIAAAECAFDDLTDAEAADKVILKNSDDVGAAFFCVDAFTNDKDANLFSTTGYSLGFGITTLSFNLGATLVQQAVTGAAVDQLPYNPGLYSGVFEMEVAFP